jgi:YcaO-like protein with predicted kinase domain
VSAAGTAKGHRAGTDRTISPAQTLERIAPLLPAMGVTRVADVTGLDCIGISVAFCCRPNSRALSVSQGKGLDLAAAKASAVMESVESFHAERVSRPVRWATYAELASRGEPVAEARLLGRSRVSPFHEHLQVPWVQGADLVSGVPTWVPYEAVHTDFRVPLPPTSGTFVCSSNGLASGNHPLEALSHALCEAIERDSTSLWQISGGEGSDEGRLDLATVDDPACATMLERYDAAGVDVAVWETTSDIRLPAFACRIGERSTDASRLLYDAGGMGCHPRREIALLRALTEAAQSRLTIIAGSRDDADREEYARVRDPEALRDGQEVLTRSRGTRDFTAVPTHENATFEEDVRLELERLLAVGLGQVIAVDLTLPEFGIPVVVAVVPGLEDFVAATDPAEIVPGQRAQMAAARPGAA